MDRRIDRGQATRQHIIGTATRLFAEHGYDAVSTEMILEACGISRGALYHHFASKEAVFIAVLHATEQRIVAHLLAAAPNVTDPVESLRAGCMTWLELATHDVVVRRVVLSDAPSVIGWQAWRTLDEEYTLGLIRGALSAVAAQGRIEAERIEPFAYMLLTILAELALLIARSPDDARMAAHSRQSLEQLLDGLFHG